MGTIYDDLAHAIRGRRRVSLRCNDLAHVIEPYLIFEDKEEVDILHGWQTSGEWKENPPPGWINLRMCEITEVDVLQDAYAEPHAGYNPNSSRFHRVLVATSTGP
jgi:hypothetical protein